ncbi:MAG TPA: type II toxin-antitoxin system prevent-host-death family antitoxin [Actinomycetota bacterium]|nr:type II toxin-antitoxin system prevent-host-death family antitoxin [Actinomycetota bacterium]
MEQLPQVSIRDLSRRPNEVLRRVTAGERLIVCRHKKPVATLQPLDGYVFQPFDGTARDVFGWPVGGIYDEIAKLSEAQRVLLRDGYRRWRLWSGRVPSDVPGDRRTMLSDLAVRGLAKKTEFGWELTGRGLAMHEALQGRD